MKYAFAGEKFFAKVSPPIHKLWAYFRNFTVYDIEHIVIQEADKFCKLLQSNTHWQWTQQQKFMLVGAHKELETLNL